MAPTTFSLPVERLKEKDRSARVTQMMEKVLEVAPAMDPEGRAWMESLLGEYVDLFDAYAEAGSLEAVQPRLREICRRTAEGGIRLDAYARVLYATSARRKLELVEQLGGEPEQLARAFGMIDAYERALFDEFTAALESYWRRRAEEATQLHHQFFGNLPFPAMMGTPDLTIREVNHVASVCLPLDEARTIGQPLPAWLRSVGVSEADIEGLLSELESAGQVEGREIRAFCPYKGDLALWASVSFVRDVDGRPQGFQATFQDVTETKRLERQLAARRATMDAIFESSPVGLIFADAGGVIQRINRHACDLLGYPPPEEIQGGDMQAFREKVKHNFRDPEGFLRAVREAYADLQGEQVGQFERIDPPRLIRYRVGPVYDPAGDAIGRLWIFTDVTRQLANEKLKNDLTHMIVHDLKSPLMAIQGGAYMLRGLVGEGNPRARQTAELIERNANRMQWIIMNLLDIERLEAGVLELERNDASIGPLLTVVVENLGLAAGGRSLVVDVAPDLGEARINVDVGLMERVLTNLVSNAIKHTRPDGRIAVRARRTPEGEIALEVADDGHGIPPEFHKKIFEKFGQAELSATGAKTDTGLGLAFCKLAVEAHGGRIAVRSAPGQGSIFTVLLPPSPGSARAAAPA